MSFKHVLAGIPVLGYGLYLMYKGFEGRPRFKKPFADSRIAFYLTIAICLYLGTSFILNGFGIPQH